MSRRNPAKAPRPQCFIACLLLNYASGNSHGSGYPLPSVALERLVEPDIGGSGQIRAAALIGELETPRIRGFIHDDQQRYILLIPRQRPRSAETAAGISVFLQGASVGTKSDHHVLVSEHTADVDTPVMTPCASGESLVPLIEFLIARRAGRATGDDEHTNGKQKKKQKILHGAGGFERKLSSKLTPSPLRPNTLFGVFCRTSLVCYRKIT